MLCLLHISFTNVFRLNILLLLYIKRDESIHTSISTSLIEVVFPQDFSFDLVESKSLCLGIKNVAKLNKKLVVSYRTQEEENVSSSEGQESHQEDTTVPDSQKMPSIGCPK